MMFAVRRWWNQYALKTGIVALAVVFALSLREAGGVPLYEMYRWITRPLHPGPSREALLKSSYTQELQQRIVELESQNRSLRQTLEGDVPESPGKIRAAVIGRSAGDWWQQILISRGSRDSVSVGDIVTGPGGIVGRVINVSPTSSRVLLVSDPTSRVGARISRSRATGYVRGEMGQQVAMEFFDKMPDVKVGDVVVTSSYSQLFPKDIVIGRVVDLDLSKSPAPEVIVELTAPLDILEWVEIASFESDAIETPVESQAELQLPPEINPTESQEDGTRQ